MKLSVVNLGTMPYSEALELQRSVASARIAGQVNDILLLVEHPPVVTLGRGTKPGHLVASEAQLRARGVELYDVERGGDVTYHGPGQLVGYPVFDLKEHKRDLHWYLRQVEESIIQAMAAFGLACARNPGFTGVWVDSGQRAAGSEGHEPGRDSRFTIRDSPVVDSSARKIASIGVHACDWVTWHGFALNVTTDLSHFDLIVPCGICDVTMTTVRRELGEAFPGNQAVTDAVVNAFGSVFSRQIEYQHMGWLVQALSVPSAATDTGRTN